MIDQLLNEILAGRKVCVDEFIEVLDKTFPLLHDLCTTAQDAKWHAEGDVHIHTDMVLEESYALLNEAKADGHTKNELKALVLSALLHDIAKPLTTKEIWRDDRRCLICPQHEELGINYLFPRIVSLDLADEVKVKCCQLVAYHQMPKRLLMRGAKQNAFARLSRQVDLRLLYYLEMADMRGRTCDDWQEQVEWIELFGEEVKERQLWGEDAYKDWRAFFSDSFTDQPQDFINFALLKGIKDFENSLINSKEEALARSFVLKEGYAKFVMLCGLSGSGKSTWAAKRDAKEWAVISLDQLRQEIAGHESSQKLNGLVLQRAQEVLKKALAANKKIIWDATNLRKELRAQFLSLAERYGAFTEIIYFARSFEESSKGNENRKRQVGNAILGRQLERIQIPEIHEAHRLRIIGAEGQVLFDSLN